MYDETPFDSRTSRRLAFGFGTLVLFTLGLIVLGALVRAHGAGLACPDWPLCFGNFVPQMDLRIAFEWSHRLVAGSVAIAFGILAISALRIGVPGSVRRLLGLAALLLAVQILLGALTVWLQLAAWTVTAHLITGNSFSLTCFLVALSLREESLREESLREESLHEESLHEESLPEESLRESNPPARAVSTGAKVWITASALLVLAQFTLGGLVSSQNAAKP